MKYDKIIKLIWFIALLLLGGLLVPFIATIDDLSKDGETLGMAMLAFPLLTLIILGAIGIIVTAVLLHVWLYVREKTRK